MKYRIVTDGFNGYEVQVKKWYWPFWVQHGWVNTHSTLSGAERYVRQVVRRKVYKIGKV